MGSHSLVVNAFTHVKMVVQVKRAAEEEPSSSDEDSGRVDGQISEQEDGDDYVSEDEELSRLKGLIPTLCRKENVTQLDVILEAIRYIDSLRGKLLNVIPKSAAEL